MTKKRRTGGGGGGGAEGGMVKVGGLGSRKPRSGKKRSLQTRSKTTWLLMAGGSCLAVFVMFLFYQHLATSSDRDVSTASGKAWTLSDEQLIALSKDTSMRYFKNELLEPLMVVRPVGSENHKKARQHIRTTLESLGWHVETDTFTDSTPLGRKTFHNIIATWDPSARQRVIFAAHYESKLFLKGPHKNFIGAIDSAVPCAILLDLARSLTPLLRTRTRALGTTPQLVFFDGEEAFENWTAKDSIYGARHLASKWAATRVHAGKGRRSPTMLESIECLVLLDLLGAKNPTIHSAFPNTHFLHRRMATMEQRLVSLDLITRQPSSFFNTNYAGRAPAVEDDHIPFVRRGVPVLHLITVPFPREWHTAGDDATILDDDVMLNWILIVRAFAAEYLHLDPTRA
ncbi:hypothetical protein PTSG_03354 [Salpingoeca rosetta]|uniref:Glutaminyl-peptide cyclotransferase n=1 Tax=Salpingoeca rosetta (strain ATCC 50818 / BSB-021) TaxID=946362 RepID=F2U4X7_SALR5|nr:uncharacterized protein PTSG_03354 [Salpingoeca rosetta]EGD82693.1 hypothetical protein PTSG_03354 [Salpingoeca rosetta]|eukprot:XP_004995929.1 hypothetical protein PTSG_03354 [Salpingoeca rosetta]